MLEKFFSAPKSLWRPSKPVVPWSLRKGKFGPADKLLVLLKAKSQILMESKKGVMPWRSMPSCRPTPH